VSELTIVDYDWLLTPTGDKLHHATLVPELIEDLEEEGTLGQYVTIDCGRTVYYVSIPGVLSRLARERCVRCCKKNGLPPGVGSPKNSPECRAILGMDS
jgi:hypothetical protein